MYSVFILTLLATLRLTTAAPSPTIESAGPASAGQVSDAKLKLRADTVYQVQGYSGSCIPENEITNVYGYDIDDGVCRFSSFPNGVPAGTDPAQSIKFTMPEGFTAQIFESSEYVYLFTCISLLTRMAVARSRPLKLVPISK